MQIFKNGFMRIDRDEAGMVTFDRNATQHGSIVVPMTSDGGIFLIREYRHGAKKPVISVVKGAADNMHESYVGVARRELREELGITCGNILVTNSEPFALPAFTQTRGRVCIAYDCKVTDMPATEDGEAIELYGIYTPDTVRKMILDGTINDAESIVALSIWLLSQ